MSVELPVRGAEVSASGFKVCTTACAATTGCKKQIHDRLAVVSQLADGSISVEITSVAGNRRHWPNSWKATVDALDLLLSRVRARRGWHPLDGRIDELALQRVRCQPFGTDVLSHLGAWSIGQAA